MHYGRNADEFLIIGLRLGLKIMFYVMKALLRCLVHE